MTSQAKAIGCGLFAFALSGCASILSGTTETIAFDSHPQGATCQLARQGTVVATVVTPGSFQLDRTKYNVDVTCRKDGYQDATGQLESGTENNVVGNILLGGVIGWAVDSASGADNKYPAQLTVTLSPLPAAVSTTEPAPEPAPAAATPAAEAPASPAP